jgi:hypothetical protein
VRVVDLLARAHELESPESLVFELNQRSIVVRRDCEITLTLLEFLPIPQKHMRNRCSQAQIVRQGRNGVGSRILYVHNVRDETTSHERNRNSLGAPTVASFAGSRLKSGVKISDWLYTLPSDAKSDVDMNTRLRPLKTFE